MIGFDTNVVVRYLTQDDGVQSAKATDLFERGLTEEEPGFVSLVAMVETVWVLERVYSLSLLVGQGLQRSLIIQGAMTLSNSSHPNCPKGEAASASAPSASSAGVLGTCRVGRAAARRLSSQTALARPEECRSEAGSSPPSRTLLTVLTVFSTDVRILITLFPARPSRLKTISTPSARRNVCARRKWPARARGFLGQPMLSLV
jgi:hypothetical protein